MNNSLTSLREEAFSPFKTQFDKLFDGIVNSMFDSNSLNTVRSLGRTNYPKIDVYTLDGQFKIEVAVPGIRYEDLQVHIKPFHEDGVDYKLLSISGSMNQSYKVPETANFSIRELRRSRFERQFLLPTNLESNDPEAILDNGILTLTWKIKKIIQQPEAKRILIQKKSQEE